VNNPRRESLLELDAALVAIDRAALGSNGVATALAQFDPVWDALRAREQAELLQLLIERVDYDGVGGGVTICFRGAMPGVAAVRYQFSAGRDGGRKVLRDGRHWRQCRAGGCRASRGCVRWRNDSRGCSIAGR